MMGFSDVGKSVMEQTSRSNSMPVDDVIDHQQQQQLRLIEGTCTESCIPFLNGVCLHAVDRTVIKPFDSMHGPTRSSLPTNMSTASSISCIITPPANTFLYGSTLVTELPLNSTTNRFLSLIGALNKEARIAIVTDWNKVRHQKHVEDQKLLKDGISCVTRSSIFLSNYNIRILPIVFISVYPPASDDISSKGRMRQQKLLSLFISKGSSSLLLSPIVKQDSSLKDATIQECIVEETVMTTVFSEGETDTRYDSNEDSEEEYEYSDSESQSLEGSLTKSVTTEGVDENEYSAIADRHTMRVKFKKGTIKSRSISDLAPAKTPGVSLIKAVSEYRRITSRNILRWTYQLFGTIHACHCKFITFNGNVNINDVWLVSDLCVVGAFRESANVASPIKYTGYSDMSKRVEEELLDIEYIRKLSACERDAYIDPQRWVSIIKNENKNHSSNNSISNDDSIHDSNDSADGNSSSSSSQSLPLMYDLLRQYSPLLNKKNAPADMSCKATSKDCGVCVMQESKDLQQAAIVRVQFKDFCRKLQFDLRALALIIVHMCLKLRLWKELQDSILHSVDSFSLTDLLQVHALPMLKDLPEVKQLLGVCLQPLEEPIVVDAVVGTRHKPGTPLSFRSGIIGECSELYTAMKGKIVTVERDRQLIRKTSTWTAKDEKARLASIQARKDELAVKAMDAIPKALCRIAEEEERRRFHMMSVEQQQKVLKKRAAREQAEKNKKARIHYLHMAAWYRWEKDEQTLWLQHALSSCMLDAYELRSAPKGKFNVNDAYDQQLHNRKLDVYQTKRVKEVLDAIDPPYLEQILTKYYQPVVHTRKRATIQDYHSDYEACIKHIAAEAAKGIADKVDNKVLGAALDASQMEIKTKVTNSTILSMLPSDQLQVKIVSMEADYLLVKSKAGAAIRGTFKEMEKKFEIPESKDFYRKMVYMCAIAILEKFKQQANMREIGEAVAASLLAAIYRQSKVIKMIRAIWVRAKSELHRIQEIEKEAKRQRILNGTYLPEDLADMDMGVSSNDGMKHQLITLDQPNVESIKCVDSTIKIVVGINLLQSNYGPLDGQSQFTCVLAVIVKEPLQLLDAVDANRSGEACNGFINTANVKPATAGEDTIESGLNDDDRVGEIVILLYDSRQIGYYQKELCHWHQEVMSKGSLVHSRPPPVTENVDASVADRPQSTPLPMDGLLDERIPPAPRAVDATVKSIGRKVLLEDFELPGKWTREKAEKRRQKQELGLTTYTDIDLFEVSIPCLPHHRKYMVHTLLSDIYKPRQGWERDSSIRYKRDMPPKVVQVLYHKQENIIYFGNSETGEYRLLLPSVQTEGTVPDAPVIYNTDVVCSEAVNTKVDKGIYLLVGAATDLKAVKVAVNIAWNMPHNNGSPITQCQIQRRMILLDQEYGRPKLDRIVASLPISCPLTTRWCKLDAVEYPFHAHTDLVQLPGDVKNTPLYDILLRNANKPLRIILQYRVRAVNSVGNSDYCLPYTDSVCGIVSHVDQCKGPLQTAAAAADTEMLVLDKDLIRIVTKSNSINDGKGSNSNGIYKANNSMISSAHLGLSRISNRGTADDVHACNDSSTDGVGMSEDKQLSTASISTEALLAALIKPPMAAAAFVEQPNNSTVHRRWGSNVRNGHLQSAGNNSSSSSSNSSSSVIEEVPTETLLNISSHLLCLHDVDHTRNSWWNHSAVQSDKDDRSNSISNNTSNAVSTNSDDANSKDSLDWLVRLSFASPLNK